jgi:hypothetical protein
MASSEDNLKRLDVIADGLGQAPENVRNYIIECFAHLIHNENFKRSIAGHLGFDSTAAERANNVAKRIAGIVDKSQVGPLRVRSG